MSFKNKISGLVLLCGMALPSLTQAGVFELSAGFNYTASNYGDSNYSWTRRWGSSVGYHFSELSEIEFAYQDVVERVRITGYQDTTFHDQIYSADWVQAVVGKSFPIQPYFKLGLGQLNRNAEGNYGFGSSPPAILDSFTVVAGAGLRIYLTKEFGLRGEATTYLIGGSIATWQDNVSVTFGASVYF